MTFTKIFQPYLHHVTDYVLKKEKPWKVVKCAWEHFELFINSNDKLRSVCNRVEIGSGHSGYPHQPGYVLSGSTGSDPWPVCKISGSDPDSALSNNGIYSLYNNALSMLDSDDGSVSPDSIKIFRWNDCTNRVFWLCGAWITYMSCTSKI